MDANERNKEAASDRALSGRNGFDSDSQFKGVQDPKWGAAAAPSVEDLSNQYFFGDEQVAWQNKCSMEARARQHWQGVLG